MKKEEYNNIWYTPSKEELVDGFQCEILTSYGWIPGTWPTIQHYDTHVNLLGGKCTLRAKIKKDDKGTI